MSDLYDITEGAKRELREWADYSDGDVSDRIHEIADSNVPVYYGDILQCALDNFDLVTNEPEIGPAFDGSPTPINIIAANIYEYLTTELWDEWNTIEQERKDARLEEIEDEDTEEEVTEAE